MMDGSVPENFEELVARQRDAQARQAEQQQSREMLRHAAEQGKRQEIRELVELAGRIASACQGRLEPDTSLNVTDIEKVHGKWWQRDNYRTVYLASYVGWIVYTTVTFHGGTDRGGSASSVHYYAMVTKDGRLIAFRNHRGDSRVDGVRTFSTSKFDLEFVEIGGTEGMLPEVFKGTKATPLKVKEGMAAFVAKELDGRC